MPFFTSSREKRLWLWAVMVFATIFATLFVGRPLASQLLSQTVQGVLFAFGMLLVLAAIIAHALRTKPGKIELSILLGILAVYVMFIVRLGLPERTHVIEYSVLAILVHRALVERGERQKLLRSPALLAFVIAFLIGVLDECVQMFLPNRTFDPQDILFNGVAVTMAVGSGTLIAWVRRRFGRA